MTREKSRGFWRDNSLSLVFGGLLLAVIVGQAFAGTADYNAQQIGNGLEPISVAQYVTSSNFAVDLMENWQSEYLQFFLYIFGTVYLVQRGSSESKKPGEEGPESDKEQKIGRYADEDSPKWAKTGDWRTAVFSRSLGLVMGVIFLLTWAASAIAGWAAYNGDQIGNRQDPLTFLGYLGEGDFWNRSLQNWQSELLAVGSMAVFAVYLRQRGSPESKPVGVAHASTGQTG